MVLSILYKESSPRISIVCTNPGSNFVQFVHRQDELTFRLRPRRSDHMHERAARSDAIRQLAQTIEAAEKVNVQHQLIPGSNA